MSWPSKKAIIAKQQTQAVAKGDDGRTSFLHSPLGPDFSSKPLTVENRSRPASGFSEDQLVLGASPAGISLRSMTQRVGVEDGSNSMFDFDQREIGGGNSARLGFDTGETSYSLAGFHGPVSSAGAPSAAERPDEGDTQHDGRQHQRQKNPQQNQEQQQQQHAQSGHGGRPPQQHLPPSSTDPQDEGHGRHQDQNGQQTSQRSRVLDHSQPQPPPSQGQHNFDQPRRTGSVSPSAMRSTLAVADDGAAMVAGGALDSGHQPVSSRSGCRSSDDDDDNDDDDDDDDGSASDSSSVASQNDGIAASDNADNGARMLPGVVPHEQGNATAADPVDYFSWQGVLAPRAAKARAKQQLAQKKRRRRRAKSAPGGRGAGSGARKGAAAAKKAANAGSQARSRGGVASHATPSGPNDATGGGDQGDDADGIGNTEHEPEPEYEVEEIVGHKTYRVVQGRPIFMYLVLWVNFEKPTWEPLSNVYDLKSLLLAYHKSRGMGPIPTKAVYDKCKKSAFWDDHLSEAPDVPADWRARSAEMVPGPRGQMVRGGCYDDGREGANKAGTGARGPAAGSSGKRSQGSQSGKLKKKTAPVAQKQAAAAKAGEAAVAKAKAPSKNAGRRGSATAEASWNSGSKPAGEPVKNRQPANAGARTKRKRGLSAAASGEPSSKSAVSDGGAAPGAVLPRKRRLRSSNQATDDDNDDLDEEQGADGRSLAADTPVEGSSSRHSSSEAALGRSGAPPGKGGRQRNTRGSASHRSANASAGNAADGDDVDVRAADVTGVGPAGSNADEPRQQQQRSGSDGRRRTGKAAVAGSDNSPADKPAAVPASDDTVEWNDSGPRRLLGIRMHSVYGLQFLVRWNDDTLSYVGRNLLYEREPYIVLAWYEAHLKMVHNSPPPHE